MLMRELAGCRLEGRFDTGNTNDFILVFSQNGHKARLAAWTMAGSSQVSLPLKAATAKEFPIINGAGRAGTIQVESGRALIPLDGSPKYIQLGDASI